MLPKLTADQVDELNRVGDGVVILSGPCNEGMSSLKEVGVIGGEPEDDIKQGGGAGAPTHDTVVSGLGGSTIRVTY